MTYRERGYWYWSCSICHGNSPAYRSRPRAEAAWESHHDGCLEGFEGEG